MNINTAEIYKSDSNTTGLFRVEWSSNDVGFGQLNIYVNDDGTVEIDSEYMGKEFVKEILDKLVDDAKLLT